MSSYPCPVCQTTADLESGCSGCGRGPDPDAAEVIRLDGEIAAARTRLESLRREYGTASTEFQDLQARRAKLAAKVLVAARLPAAVAQPQVVRAQPVAAARTAPQAVARPEASPRTVQNLLLILGGVLLGTAAIVFTAVAWDTFGDGGRALILAVVTALTLAVPIIAKARRLRATAETFAALGLLLVVLDGFAAWYVNLLGVADDLSGWTYAGIVAAITATVGLSYGLVTRLAGPLIIAAIAVQPAAPLLLAEALGDHMLGWSLLFSALAAANLLLIASAPALARGVSERSEGAPQGAPVAVALRVIGWLAASAALLYAHAVAHILLWSDRYESWEGPAALAASLLVLVAAGLVARSRVLLGAACGWAVLVIAEVVWHIARAADPDYQLVRVALAVAVIGIGLALVANIGGPLAAAARLGARIGGLVAAGTVGVVALFRALGVAVESIGSALPWWHAVPAPAEGPYDWSLPVAVLLLTVAVVALVRPGFGGVSGVPAALDLGAGGVVLTVLAAAPDAAAAPWLPSTLDLAGAVALACWAWWRARSVSGALLIPLWGGAALLGLHGLVAGLGRPTISAGVSGALLVIGLGLALAARGQELRARCLPGAVGLGLAVTQVPLLVASIAEALDEPSARVFHSAIVAIAALPAVMLLVRRYSPMFQLATLVGYGLVALATVPMSFAYAAVTGADANPIYMAIGGLGLAAAVALADEGLRRSLPSVILLLILPGIATLAAAETLVAVFLAPLEWLDQVWTGVVRGVGLSPAGVDVPRLASVPDAVAITIVVVTLGLVIFIATGRLWPALRALARLGSIPLLVWLAVAQAPWPTVPLVTLVGGLVLIVATALRSAASTEAGASSGSTLAGGAEVFAALALVTGSVQIVAGFAGLLPEKWSTITAFALVTIAFGAIAVFGRTEPVKIVGAVLAGPAWLGLALSSALAAELRPRYVGLTLLAAAAVLLFLATVALPERTTTAAVQPVMEPEQAAEPSQVEGAAPGWRRARWLVGLVALEPIAHLAALITLGIAVDSGAKRVAEVCLLWGIAVGLTALWGPARLTRTIAAGVIETVAWWSMLIAMDVTTLEAYTLPVALVGLVIGFFALRKRPELSSWVGYGPALAAAFGPSTVAMLPLDSSPWRRLFLGVAAFVAVLAGSIRRRQAPVVLGAIVLVLLALHEIIVGWDLLPRWVWFALGGGVLVGLGITYERRRRDVARLKEKISTMR